MASLGSSLEEFNAGLVIHIEAGVLAGNDLDEQMVRREQLRVQECLDALRARSERTYRLLIEELNRLLTTRVARLLAGRRRFAESAYYQALAAVRARLQRPIDFSIQSDREAVGFALVALSQQLEVEWPR
jgi:hexokinase